MAFVPSEQLIEHALALVVKSEVAPGEAAGKAQTALQKWCGKSAEHAAAAREARRRWGALGDMAGDLREHFHMDAAAGAAGRTAKQRQRRNLLLSAAGMLGTGLAAGRGLQWYWRQPTYLASIQTRTAEVRQIVLGDGPQGAGSRLELGPLSAIDISLYRSRRRVVMDRGEVRFDVAPDAARPFEVLTPQARIEVVGTVFTVRDRGGPLTVGVEHGHVRVHVRRDDSMAMADTVVNLRPGQVAEIRDGQSGAVHKADATALSSWREGWLVFENMPLQEALFIINAYRASPIEGIDRHVGALRLTGRFKASDTDGLVAVLPTVLPLTTHIQRDGRVELRMR